MKSVVLRLAICTFVVSLMGCSSLGLDDLSLQSKKIDYKTAAASKAPTLEIPPDLTSPARDDRFAVPDNGGKGTATSGGMVSSSSISGDRSESTKGFLRVGG